LSYIGSGGFSGTCEKPRSGSGAILPGGNSKDPVNIDAAKRIISIRNKKLVYTGNVVATQGKASCRRARLSFT